MAVGDDAIAAGYPLVSGSDELQQVYVEVNRTRDFVAQVLALIQPVWSTSHGGTGASDIGAAKVNLGFAYGPDGPDDTNGGAIDGNVYFRIPS